MSKSKDSYAGIKRNPLLNISGKPYMLFLHLLMWCNHKDNPDYLFGDKPLPLKRGQMVTSIPQLAKKTGYSPQEIRTALASLSNLQLISSHSTGILTNKARLISVTNIDFYLHKKEELTDPSTDNQQTGNRRLTSNKNDKNNKNEEIAPPYSERNLFGENKYHYEGHVVKLTLQDFNKWKSTFYSIPDLKAELLRIDEQLRTEGVKNWYMRATAMLNAKHQGILNNNPGKKRKAVVEVI